MYTVATAIIQLIILCSVLGACESAYVYNCIICD